MTSRTKKLVGFSLLGLISWAVVGLYYGNISQARLGVSGNPSQLKALYKTLVLGQTGLDPIELSTTAQQARISYDQDIRDLTVSCLHRADKKNKQQFLEHTRQVAPQIQTKTLVRPSRYLCQKLFQEQQKNGFPDKCQAPSGAEKTDDNTCRYSVLLASLTRRYELFTQNINQKNEFCLAKPDQCQTAQNFDSNLALAQSSASRTLVSRIEFDQFVAKNIQVKLAEVEQAKKVAQQAQHQFLEWDIYQKDYFRLQGNQLAQQAENERLKLLGGASHCESTPQGLGTFSEKFHDSSSSLGGIGQHPDA